jgi:hypothetical protein
VPFTFNIAKGRIVELALRAPNFQVVLLEAAEADAVLKDYDTLAALLAAAGNTELAHASYARKTGVAGTVIIDDTLDETRVDLPAQTWVSLSGNQIVKAIVCFQEVVSGLVIPLTGHDVAVTPDGSNFTLRFP